MYILEFTCTYGETGAAAPRPSGRGNRYLVRVRMLVLTVLAPHSRCGDKTLGIEANILGVVNVLPHLTKGVFLFIFSIKNNKQLANLLFSRSRLVASGGVFLAGARPDSPSRNDTSLLLRVAASLSRGGRVGSFVVC